MFNTTLPALSQRSHISDKFCQYIRVENRQGCIMPRWENELRLRRNFELYQTHDQRFASLSQLDHPYEKELVNFWINLVLNEQLEPEYWEPKNRVQLALEHLYAYCEESCYYATRKVCQQDSSLGWEDGLLIGRTFLLDSLKFQKVLRNYDANQVFLRTYIQTVLFNQIREQASVCRISKWRLLCQQSDKKLKTALEREGVASAQTSCIIFARQYFKQVYQINTVQNPAYRNQGKWPNPQESDFIEVVKIYNTQKLSPSVSHEVYASAELNVEQLKNWMEKSINALRNDFYTIVPPNRCQPLEKPSSQNQLNLKAQQQEQVDLEKDEEQTNSLKRIEPIFKKQLYSFRDDQKEIILLYYGLKWKQKRIAKRYEVRQDAISKRLTTVEKNLLKVVVQLKETSDWVVPYINQWLKKSYVSPNYADYIEAALVAGVKTLPEKYRKILQLHYGAEPIKQEEIMSRFNLTQTEFLEILNTAIILLNQAVLTQIESWRKELVETWLESYSRQTINSVFQNLQVYIDVGKEINPEIIDAVLKGCLEIWH